MKVCFSSAGWAGYLYWQTQDKKTIHKINKLIESILRDGSKGIGKAERLKGDKAGFCSRHIDEKNRLLYRMIDNDTIEITQCREHYDD